MPKLYTIYQKFASFLPIQLLVAQMRNHKIVLGFWVLLLGVVYGFISKQMGGTYLFLEPEYLGNENFWSVFIVGASLGLFLFAYMITIYINESYRYHFIGQMRFPFLTLAYNNMLVPGLFLTFYLYRFIDFHILTEGGFSILVFEKIMGLLLGIGAFFLLSASYFFARRTYLQYFGKKLEEKLSEGSNNSDKKVIFDKAKKSFRAKRRTDYFLKFPFKVIKVDNLPPVEFRQVVRSLSNHHGKLLLMQILAFVFIAVLGILEGNRYFQIPAGASFLLVFALGLMILGAVTFWFRKLGVGIFVAFLAVLAIYPEIDFLQDRHHAFGLDYSKRAVPYTYKKLRTLNHEQGYDDDKAAMIRALNKWKANYQAVHGEYAKPKAVFAMASGGGLRSAFWTLTVMQQLDSITGGELPHDLRLLSGASGGMFGLVYYRELYMQRMSGYGIDPTHKMYRDKISQDILNRIMFKKFSNTFLPNGTFSIGDNVYEKDEGYSFEDQLTQNLPELRGRTLQDYAAWEAEGKLPLTIFTPTIINQGRKLYISASPISYLVKPNTITNRFRSREKGVEFRRLFADHNGDQLLISSALRMNATFPFVMPIVELPTEPVMEVMDAGAIDNFGTPTAIQYLYEFKEWFAENTEAVIFVQIRDTGREPIIVDPSKNSLLSEWFTPIGGGYNSMLESKDTSNDYLLEFVPEWYQGKIEVVPFEYPVERESEPASLSWHLTKREKNNLLKSLEFQHNQRSFQLIKDLYNPQLIVQH